jgi:arabinofuranan 3-O-arabinosyltransferase
MGGSVLVQLPALLAIIAVGIAALPRPKHADRAGASGSDEPRPPTVGD